MTPFPRPLTLILGLLALLALQSVGLAQAPKAGDYYEDAVDLGFKVKMPKNWEFTPPQPGDRALIGKYTPSRNRYINISPENVLWLEAYLIRLDRRAKAGEPVESSSGGDDGAREAGRSGEEPYAGQEQDVLDWLDDHLAGGSFRVKESKDRAIDKVDATQLLIEGELRGDPFHVFAEIYRLHPDCDVVLLMNGPADDKKWRKYESEAVKMARSFRRVEVERVELSEAREGDHGLRSTKRAELEREVATTPGWRLYETENYFIVSNNEDADFLDELMERLEAIRAVYEELYPFDEAARIRAEAARRKAEEADADEEDREPGETSSGYTSRQRSQCSVVRVCKNQTQYHEYGGPGGSAGYWAAFHEELVIYDDQEGGGRRNTWAVLNHEAFHQYIFYLYGSLAPHSWYNEGHGDFFSGYQYRHRKFVLKPFDWRQRLVQGMVREEKFVPLEKLVRFSQREYYSTSQFGTGPGEHYAQGWSFIWFLRTGAGKAKGWDPAWERILPTYFEVLASSEDLDEAVDRAFEGVDYEALTEAWKDYTLR
jgi:hypothetical protein